MSSLTNQQLFYEVFSFLEKHPIISILFGELDELTKQLTTDYNQGHISQKNLELLKSDITSLLSSVAEFNQKDITNKFQQLKKNCSYNIAVKSKWNLLGAAISAFLFTALVVIAIIISKGLAAIPLYVWFVSPGGGGLLFGMASGKQLAQWQAKEKITSFANSINGFFAKVSPIKDKISHKYSCAEDFKDPAKQPKNIYELACKIIYYQIYETESDPVLIRKFIEEFKINSNDIVDDRFLNTMLHTPIRLNKLKTTEKLMSVYFDIRDSESVVEFRNSGAAKTETLQTAKFLYLRDIMENKRIPPDSPVSAKHEGPSEFQQLNL